MNLKPMSKFTNDKLQDVNKRPRLTLARAKFGRVKGFTLLELLVVIGIIGILVSIATVAYTAAQRKSRDSRRESDIRAVQGALEVYYTENSYVYPTTCSDVQGLYLKSSWPVDPVNDPTSDLVYGFYCDPNSYYLCAKLEVAGKGNSSSRASDSNGTGHSWSASGNYYCMTNLQ